MQRTLYQVVRQYEQYFAKQQPDIQSSRSNTELRIRLAQTESVIRRAAATSTRSQGRLR